MTYLCQPRAFIEDRLPSIRNYFGCLANAVAYLHRQRVRHRDLKPQNILIKNHVIYITDFGNALDWSKKGRDTTNDSTTPFTEQYVAPEIAKRSMSSRNSASDVWSLGVVFLDMVTILRGRTIRALRNFLETHGTRHPCVWGNAPATHEWFESIRQVSAGPESDNEPLMWIKDMTQSSPSNRPLAGAVANQIRNTAARGHFIGQCCATDDDFEEYPSPPTSHQSDEDGDIHFDDMPPEIDLGEKPFGSLVEASRQSSIERWLVQDDSVPDFASANSDDFEEDTVNVPYDIVMDDPTMSTIIPDQDLADDESNYTSNSVVLDQCEGYDIVQDGSDDEERLALGGYGYEVMEDSSASEASTVRQIRPRMDETPTDINVNTKSLLPDGQLISDEAFRAIEAQLDALPEDPIDIVPQKDPKSAQTAPATQLEGSKELKVSESPNQQMTYSSAEKRKPKSKVRFSEDDAKPLDIRNSDTPTQGHVTGPVTSLLIDEDLAAVSESPPYIPHKELKVKSKGSSLNAANLAKFTSDTAKPPSTPKKEIGKVKRNLDKLLADEPQISPSLYMQEVWEAASSAPTSVMSERTKKAFAGFGSGLAWQDRTTKFLEKYVKAGSASAVRELLHAGCNPGTKDKPRIRPLMLAVKGGSQRHNKCVQALLAAGANVNARERSGRTALHYAIEHENFRGYTNLIRDLLEAGADPNNKDKSGDFPLLQILYGGYEPLQKHRRDALACLLRPEFATDVNVMPPGTLNMPLHLAVRRKDPWAVSMLITRGAKVNEPNGSGMTPLMLAANSWSMKMLPGQVEVLRFLLEAGVIVNEQDELGKTALHFAASNLCEKAVRLLLGKGADPQILDKEPHRAYHYARDRKEKIKKAPEAHASIMQLLFESMGQSDFAIRDNECAVVTAVVQSRVKDARYHFNHGAQADHLYESIEKTPLLHIAMRNQNNTMARLLIDQGASIDMQDKHGQDAFKVLRSMDQNDFTNSFGEYMNKNSKIQVPKPNERIS